MEAVGLAASIMALVDVAGKLIGYLNRVKYAKREATDMLHELQNMQAMLEILRMRIQERKIKGWAECTQILSLPDGPIAQIQTLLEEMLSRMRHREISFDTHQPGIEDTMNSPKQLGGAGRRNSWLNKLRKKWTSTPGVVFWPFTADEVYKIAVNLDRYKQWVQLALADDHIALSEVLNKRSEVLNKRSEVLNKRVLEIQYQVKQSKEILHDVKSSIRTVQTSNSNLEKLEEARIMHWLSPLNLWESHHRILNTWQVGTGDWLLDHTLFREWHFGQGNLLFCPGIPGAGKTVFASLIVNHLWTTYEKDDKIGVGFIYCNYKDREQQTLVNLVGALLSQLASKKMPKELVKLYEKHGLLQRSRPQRVFIDALASLLHRCSKTFIIVDALDEYADPQELMGELFRLQQRVTDWGCVLKLLVTSRETGTISKLFKNAAKIEIQAREEDIRTYLRAEFEKNVRLQMHMKKEPALILEIIDTIVRKAEGMFLLAKLHMESVATKTSIRNIRKALECLPDSLTSIYDLALERISSMGPDDRDLAMRSLYFIVFAFTPLTTQELQHALAIDTESRHLQDLVEGMVEPECIVQVCAGLVTVDNVGQVRLVHYTVQEYFDQNRDRMFPSGHQEMALICTQYLLFEGLENCCTDEDALRNRLEQYALIKYAACNWSKHIKAASEIKMQDLILSFFRKESYVASTIQILRAALYGADLFAQWLCHQKQIRAYHSQARNLIVLAGLFGLPELLKRETKNKGTSAINVRDSAGQTMLSLAAQGGDKEIVEMLLARDDFKTHEIDFSGDNALISACEGGHEEIVRLLLTKYRDRLKKSYQGMTNLSPLYHAARGGYKDIVKLLIDEKVNPDDRDYKSGNTPLCRAAASGYLEVVEVLLEHGALVDKKSTQQGRTPLFHAAENGHVAIVHLLLEYGANPNSRDYTGSSALIAAGGNGHLECVKALVERGADVEHKEGEEGENVLLVSAGEGRMEVVRYLLEHNPPAKIECVMRDGRSALSLAAAQNFPEVVRLLLQHGAKINQRSYRGFTPLAQAAIRRHIDVMKVLLDWGKTNGREAVEIDARDEQYGQTPLSWAVQMGFMDVVEILLTEGADVLARSSIRGQTPVGDAAEFGHIQILQMLLTKCRELASRSGQALSKNPELGYPAAVPDYDGETPLARAAQYGSVEAIRVLLACPEVDPAVRDCIGRTPFAQAAEYGQGEFMRALLAEAPERFDPAAKDHFGRDALSRAAQYGHVDAIQLLLQIPSVDPNARDQLGRCALTYAAQHGHIDAVKLLLNDPRVDPMCKDTHGRTALSLAAENGLEDVVRVFMGRKDVDPREGDIYGKTPLEWAREKRVIVVFEEFERKKRISLKG